MFPFQCMPELKHFVNTNLEFHLLTVFNYFYEKEENYIFYYSLILQFLNWSQYTCIPFDKMNKLFNSVHDVNINLKSIFLKRMETTCYKYHLYLKSAQVTKDYYILLYHKVSAHKPIHVNVNKIWKIVGIRIKIWSNFLKGSV